MMPRATPR